MYSLGLRVRRFVSEVLSDRDFGRMYEIRSGRDLASFASGGRRVADRSFVIPAFAMMGALAWQVNESQWKKHSFSGVFEGRSHGDLPGISSLCVLLLFLRSLSLLALRYLFRSHRSLHPFKLGSEGDTQRFVNICLISDDAEKGMRQGFKGWAESLIFSNMPTVTWAQSRRSTIFVF